MIQGFERVREIPSGELDGRRPLDAAGPGAPARERRRRRLRGRMPDHPGPRDAARARARHPIATFDHEFRAGLGYHQPASALASVGVMAAASGDTASKYVARRETPLYIPENCTQCMECIAVCPDTALPNCAQDLDTILRTAIQNYVRDPGERQKMFRAVPEIDKRARELMREPVQKQEGPAAAADPPQGHDGGGWLLGRGQGRTCSRSSTRSRWPTTRPTRSSRRPERKSPGSGGIFSIFVSDLCKGCAACVTACGDHQALRMVQETEDVNAEHETGTAFLNLLPDTVAEVPRALQQRQPARLEDRGPAQPPDGAQELRRARLRATAPAPAAARRASCTRWPR